MKCKDCPHWQGIKGQPWGDCHRVIFHLLPDLYEIAKTDDYGLITGWLEEPFDPHDVKYWKDNDLFKYLYKKLCGLPMPKGVLHEVVTERDSAFYDQGGEYERDVRLHYFKTNKDYTCKGD